MINAAVTNVKPMRVVDWRAGEWSSEMRIYIDMRRIGEVVSFPGRLLLISALLFPISGCSRSETDYAPLEERLESGGMRLTYSQLESRQLAFEKHAEWMVWEPGGAYLFSTITDIEGGQDSFFILDGGNLQVIELNVDGSLRNVFGREGSGPGEFRYPLQLFLNEKQLWISDVRNRRFSVYEMDGNYLMDVRWPGGSRLVNEFAITPDGGILHGGSWPLTVAELTEQEPVYYLAEFPGAGLWEEGAPVHLDTLFTMKSLPWIRIGISSEEGEARAWVGPPEFSPQPRWSVGSEEIVTVTSADYRFEIREMSGEVVLEVVVSGADLRVTDAHRDWFFNHVAPRRFGTDGSFTLTSDSRARFSFANQMQAIDGIALDGMGRVWVQANTGEPGATRLDLFERDGTYIGNLGELPLPAAFSCNGFILIRESAEDGLDRFQVGIVKF